VEADGEGVGGDVGKPVAWCAARVWAPFEMLAVGI